MEEMDHEANSQEYSFNDGQNIVDNENVGSNDEDILVDEDSPKQDIGVTDEPLIETPPVASSRPRRVNAGTGIHRLEPVLGTKEYASVKSKQMLMKNDGKHRTKTCRLVGKLVHIVLTQISAKKGIKLYGHRAVADMFKQL